ncbi:hypothetical protein pipiens_008274 [Culex pipiens pipiens]|uniref:Cuticular protein n=1 Tax=Culex pipiens pipiens TaxID=38569 RepID=A0ABD1DHZ5_CULPP
MGGRTLMLCGFLVVLVAVARCAGSRSDVRQQLRSEVVYSERNHKEGRYKYGYAVKKGESQFHHQRSLDGAMYGCYGYVDPQGKLFITHYLADMAGYRLVNMANPDRKLAERIRNLGTADNPIDLQHLFPAECQEDGDMKTLKETADAMKASLAESGDQSASYRSRSSSYTVSSGSQDSAVRGTSEDDYPRSEVMRLPATPRPSTPASPDAVTVSYQLPSGTDRTPVTPRPTTVFRPTTPGFPATTVKSLIYRTTVGPSGDIYDEIEEEPELGSRPTLMSPQIPEQKPPITTSGGVTVIPSISQGVLVENTALPHCSDVTLMIPADAKQIFVRTNSPAFRVFGDGDPNERIRLVEPGVYEVNLGATSGIQFNQYRADEGDWKRSNKLQLDMDRSFDYGELVQKPLYSRTQSATTGDGGNQARLNNPYLPLVPAPVEARNAGGSSAEQVLTPEQRSLLSLVPSWKKVLLYY